MVDLCQNVTVCNADFNKFTQPAGEKNSTDHNYTHGTATISSLTQMALDWTVNSILFSFAHITGQLLHTNFRSYGIIVVITRHFSG